MAKFDFKVFQASPSPDPYAIACLPSVSLYAKSRISQCPHSLRSISADQFCRVQARRFLEWLPSSPGLVDRFSRLIGRVK